MNGPAQEDRRVIFLLAQARKQVFGALDRALLAAAGVTTAQAGALLLLAGRDGCALGELSAGLGLDNSAITTMADRLEARALVRREPSREDRRVVRVWLTGAGRSAARKALPVVRAHNAHILGRYSEAERAVFLRVLRDLAQPQAEPAGTAPGGGP